MKRNKNLLALCGVLLLAASLTAFTFRQNAPAPGDLEGSWQIEGDPQRVAILIDGYFVQTTYKENEPEFISTTGGPFSYDGSTMSGTIEFNSAEGGQVGESFSIPAKLEGERLTVTYEDGTTETWERVDKAENELAGVWRITQRQNDGEMNEMPLKPRRTLKILSGTRFQWAAINVETGEFSGTGGGTYTFEDGKYTENIEFFSRDNSRVGMSLSFEGEVKGDNWHHKGKSSKGNPIYEVWSKFKR